MFDKEGFIADYVEAVRTNDTVRQQEVLARLEPEHNWDFRKELVEGILADLKELEGDYSTHTEFLDNQLVLIEEEKNKEDSNNKEAKEDTKAEEATVDVAADVVADEDAEVAGTATEAESGGYAPTAEEETEKPEA